MSATASYEELKDHWFEANESGKLDADEILGLFSDLSREEVEGFIEKADTDGDGLLSFDELLAFFYGVPEKQSVRREEEESDEEGDEEFTDSSFPLDCATKRAAELVPGESKLFFNIEPTDIMQGSLGDCWLMAALAGMAEFPGLIESCFEENVVQENGKYHVNMWDGNAWNAVVIDDAIPVTGWGAPMYAQPADSELWVLLLEKAVAKWNGGYENINGGLQHYAWWILTGCNDVTILRLQEEGEWQECKPAWGDAKDVHANCSFYLGNGIPTEKVWDNISEWDQSNFLMGASTNKDDGKDGGTGHSAGESIRGDGIVKGHAYSVIKATVAGGIPFVQLRNPWGNSAEWTGPWSDDAPEWAENPEIAEELDLDDKDDGMFWMTFEDFSEVFEMVTCAKVKIPAPKRQQRTRGSHAPSYKRRARTGKKIHRPMCGGCAVM